MNHPEQIQVLTEVLIGLSWLAAIFAVYCFIGGSTTSVLNLAGTQWMLVSAVLGINAVFFRHSLK